MHQLDANYRPGPIAAKGCFTGEFGLGDGLPIEQAPYVIERDRINEGVRKGFNRKLLPMALDPKTGDRTAGGYYLLTTGENAKDMFDWYRDEHAGFILDGIPILQREYFLNPVAHHWAVIGAEDFKDLHHAQKIVRFERWRSTSGDAPQVLTEIWPTLCDAARERGLSSVWLLWNGNQDETIGLVTVASRDGNRDVSEPDFASVAALAGQSSLGDNFEGRIEAAKSFDRTSWIYSIWFPYTDGPDSKPTLWPNSPPFPGLS